MLVPHSHTKAESVIIEEVSHDMKNRPCHGFGILTSRQPHEKLQCLCEILMLNTVKFGK